jgi:hypothetical protein
MKYPEKTKHFGLTYKANVEHRRSRRGKDFWIIMYTRPGTLTEGWIHLPDGWQDMDRTLTAQDIYWDDKVDWKPEQLEAAKIISVVREGVYGFQPEFYIEQCEIW